MSIRTPPDPPKDDAPAGDPARASAPPLRVLVLEHDPEMGRLVCAALGRIGHDSLLAESATRTLQLLGRGMPDVFLMDLDGPTGDGLTLLRAARRAHPQFESVAVVATSTSLPEEHSATWGELDRAGVGALLAKPYRVQALRDALAEVTDPARDLGARAEPRVPVALPMSLLTAGRWLDGEVTDLSVHGLRVRLTAAKLGVTPRSRMRLTVDLPRVPGVEPLTAWVAAEVRWKHESADAVELGLAVRQVTPGAAEQAAAALVRLLEAPPQPRRASP